MSVSSTRAHPHHPSARLGGLHRALRLAEHGGVRRLFATRCKGLEGGQNGTVPRDRHERRHGARLYRTDQSAASLSQDGLP